MFVSDFPKARSLYFIPVAWKLGWDNQLTGWMIKEMVQKALRELMNPTGNVEPFLRWVWEKQLRTWLAYLGVKRRLSSSLDGQVGNVGCQPRPLSPRSLLC